MSQLIKPIDYQSLLDMKQTEQGIKLIKEFFQQNISTELRLRRVTAPLFVLQGLGINDDLNGVERAVTFPIKDLGDARAEVVHSLAKWKRLSLAEYQIEPGYGIYTDTVRCSFVITASQSHWSTYNECRLSNSSSARIAFMSV